MSEKYERKNLRINIDLVLQTVSLYVPWALLMVEVYLPF
jgi:hypothetical protein